MGKNHLAIDSDKGFERILWPYHSFNVHHEDDQSWLILKMLRVIRGFYDKDKAKGKYRNDITSSLWWPSFQYVIVVIFLLINDCVLEIQDVHSKELYYLMTSGLNLIKLLGAYLGA